MNEVSRKPARTVTELASARQHQKTSRPSWSARWRVSPWCCAGHQRCSEETAGMSATAFTKSFTELDVPRSSGAVSGRFRTGCAARVLVGCSVLVTCRCLAVVRVLAATGPGALPLLCIFRAFSVGFDRAKRHLLQPPPRSGCLCGLYRGFRARCGQAEVPRFYLR